MCSLSSFSSFFVCEEEEDLDNNASTELNFTLSLSLSSPSLLSISPLSLSPKDAFCDLDLKKNGVGGLGWKGRERGLGVK